MWWGVLKDRKGVSPVIGVILMVAITVILAAVIASFVFGMGGKVKAAPNAQIMLEDNDDMVNTTGEADKLFDIVHYGGDTLKCNEIKLVVSVKGGNTSTLVWDGTDSFDSDELTCNVSDGLISVGDRYTVEETSGGAQFVDEVPATITLKIIHIPTNSIIFEGDVLVQ